MSTFVTPFGFKTSSIRDKSLESLNALSRSGGIIYGDLTITGDLKVAGEATTTTQEEVFIDDNFIVLNSGVSEIPEKSAGIEIERGTSINATIQWNEALDRWQAGLSDDPADILTSRDVSPLGRQLLAATDTTTAALILNLNTLNKSVPISGLTKFVSILIGGSESETIIHNLGTEDIIVSVHDLTTREIVSVGVIVNDEKSITLLFGETVAPQTYRITIIG